MDMFIEIYDTVKPDTIINSKNYIIVSVNNIIRHKFTLTYILHPLAFHFHPVIWEPTLEFVSYIIWQI
jgi:hypothetical protein